MSKRQKEATPYQAGASAGYMGTALRYQCPLGDPAEAEEWRAGWDAGRKAREAQDAKENA